MKWVLGLFLELFKGRQGVCLYRGFPVPELVEAAEALQVAYLLLVGEKPTATQYQAFCREIQQHMPRGRPFEGPLNLD